MQARRRMFSGAAPLWAILLTLLLAACDEDADGLSAKLESAVREALAEATEYPTRSLEPIIKLGVLVTPQIEREPLPLPLGLYVPASLRVFDIEGLDGHPVNGRVHFRALLRDAKAGGDVLPESARMLTSASIKELTYAVDADRLEGQVVFEVGGALRIRATFEADIEDDRVRVTLFRLPDSGWVTKRREDGTWQFVYAQRHGPTRGIYGGMPTLLMEGGRTLEDAGVNAVWLGERSITTKRIRRLRKERVAVYAEFNTLHCADYLKEHPGAAPVGPDGKPSPPPHGWQGICPTHEGYRAWRMEAFRKLVTEYAVDGVWLDYHHAHASWERAEPDLPDTCFCARCLQLFQEQTGIDLGDAPVPEVAERLLGPLHETWTRWRSGILTDWVREFRTICGGVPRPIILGTFHCPWTEAELDRALRTKLGIDLRAQSKYVDVFSPMLYHARFGHAEDPAWISRQTVWLAKHLRLRGDYKDRAQIWPIVQLSDWGEPVPAPQIAEVLEHGARAPAQGVIAFAWGGIRKDAAKIEALVSAFKTQDQDQD